MSICGDGRALLHVDDQNAVVDFQADVLEKTRRVKRTNRLGRLIVGHRLADFDRHVRKYGSRFRALDALNADVLDHKRLERMSAERHRGCDEKQNLWVKAHLVLTVYEPADIVIKRKCHEQKQQSHPDVLANLHHLGRNGTSLNNFKHIIH